MKRNLYVFIGIWALLMAMLPICNVVMQGVTATAQLAMSKGRLSKSGLRKALFNLDQPLRVLSRLVQPFGISIDPGSVVVGQDGWLYLGDKYAGTLTAMREGVTQKDEAQAQAISEAMLKWDEWLARQGVRAFRIMIGPDKHSVHPEGLPGWVEGRRPAKISLLVTGSASDLYVDLSEGLRLLARQTTEPLYFKTDTHWNALGAAYGLRGFAAESRVRSLALRWPVNGELTLVRVETRSGGDLAKFLRMGDSLPDREPIVELPLVGRPDVRVIDYDTNEVLSDGFSDVGNYPLRTVFVSSPKALNRVKVLWVRDSFGTALSPYMAATFSEVVQMHYDLAFDDEAQRLADLVEQWRPDLVFITVVERAALSNSFTKFPPRQ